MAYFAIQDTIIAKGNSIMDNDSYPGMSIFLKLLQTAMNDHREEFETIKEGASRLCDALQPYLDYQQQLLEVIRPGVSAFETALVSLREKVARVEIPESFVKALIDSRYIRILKDINWPLFLEDDYDIKRIILELCGTESERYPIEALAERICNYYTNDRIDVVTSEWKDCLSQNPARLSVLEEAVQLHKQGSYYGSTAIFMCQVDGLIEDMWHFAKDNEIMPVSENEEAACELFDIAYSDHLKNINKKLPSERHLILRLATMPDTGELYWEAVSNYLYKTVFTRDDFSTLDSMYRDHNPLRNKICHGEQISFGTKEISLKAIFIVNLLLHLKEEIEWLGKKEMMSY